MVKILIPHRFFCELEFAEKLGFQRLVNSIFLGKTSIFIISLLHIHFKVQLALFLKFIFLFDFFYLL